MRAAFEPLAERFHMDWALHDEAVRPRVLIMVPERDGCLNHLLYRRRIGALPGDVVATVSNHDTGRPMADAAGIAFHHQPIRAGDKAPAEAALLT